MHEICHFICLTDNAIFQMTHVLPASAVIRCDHRDFTCQRLDGCNPKSLSLRWKCKAVCTLQNILHIIAIA